MEGPRYGHQKLEVYGIALDFAEAADRIAGRLPPDHRHLADQLRRASTSIVLNVAEGGDEYSLRDKRRFYRFALRSAGECSAILDLGKRIRIIDERVAIDTGRKLGSIIAMLTNLARDRHVRR